MSIAPNHLIPTTVMNIKSASSHSLAMAQAVAATLLLAFASSVHAADRTWANSGTDYNTAANWGGVLPGTGDAALFSSIVTNQPNLSAPITNQQIRFTTSTGGWTLFGGSALTLTSIGTGATAGTGSAIVSANTSGTTTISAPLVLGGAAATTATFTQSTGGALAISGNILSTNAIAGLTLSGQTAFTLSGNNTYAGNTTLASSSSTLNINSATALGAGGAGTALVTAQTTPTIDNTSGSAIILANNNNITLSATTTILTFLGSNNLSFGSGTLTINGSNKTISTTAGALTIGNIDADTTARVLTKSGAGTLVVSNAAGSNFQGGLILSAGTAIVGNKAALGTGTLTLGGGTLQANTDLSGANAIANNVLATATSTISGSNNITLSGTWTNSGTVGRTLNSSLDAGKTLVITGPVNLTDAATVYGALVLNGTGNTTISGNITPGLGTSNSTTSVQVGNTGTTTLSGTNTYSGQTRLFAGTTVLDSANALPSTSNLILNGGVLGLGTGSTAFTRALGTIASQVRFAGVGGSNQGGFAAYGANATVNLGGASGAVVWGTTSSFILDGWTFILGSASANATIDFQNPLGLGTTGTNTRTIQVDNGSAATDAVLSGVISGNANQTFSKTGTGTLSLTAANTYSGGTTVNAGALLVNNASGSGTGSGAVSVLAGGTIGGSGIIAGSTTVAGTLSPGNSLGLLTFNDTTAGVANLTLQTGSNSIFEINGNTRGTLYDAVDIEGALVYDGTLTLNFGFAANASDSFNLFDFATQSGSFTTINFLNPNYAGTFDAASGVLTVTAVPEPGTWALLVTGFAAFMLIRRRRLI